jgi:hypothetical protein
MSEHSPLSEKEVVSANNRPDLRPRKKGVLVHDDGFTGPGRIRQLGKYKGSLSETNFRHEYSRFAGPGEEED